MIATVTVSLAALVLLFSHTLAQDCAPGTFRTSDPNSGQVICPPCPPNTISDAVNSLACRPCSANSVAAASRTTCFCNPGFLFVPSTGTCARCPAGQFRAGPNVDFLTECILCAPNSFPDLAQTTCFCNEGFFFNSEQGCSPCPPGTFRAGANIFFATACTPCPPGQVQTGVAAGSCMPCPSGSTASGAIVCLPDIVFTPPSLPNIPVFVPPVIPNVFPA